MVVLDTSVIIDHLRQAGKDTYLRRLAITHPHQLTISPIVLQELYEGQSTNNPVKESQMLATLSPLKILPYTEEIAKVAGKLARDHIPAADLADLAIAATAIQHQYPLATLNPKDLKSLPDLEILPLP